MENILKAHGIMFHHFHGKNHIECQGSLSAEKLEEILEFYKEQGYRYQQRNLKTNVSIIKLKKMKSF